MGANAIPKESEVAAFYKTETEFDEKGKSASTLLLR